MEGSWCDALAGIASAVSVWREIGALDATSGDAETGSEKGYPVGLLLGVRYLSLRRNHMLRVASRRSANWSHVTRNPDLPSPV
jgi:hypothetical protein